MQQGLRCLRLARGQLRGQLHPHPVQRALTQRSPLPEQLIGYVFNAKTQDVTLFDPATQEVLVTRPLARSCAGSRMSSDSGMGDTSGRTICRGSGAGHRRRPALSHHRAHPSHRRYGPAHSLMLTPDRKTAWVNVAGGDYLAVLDLETGEVADEVATGSFP